MQLRLFLDIIGLCLNYFNFGGGGIKCFILIFSFDPLLINLLFNNLLFYLLNLFLLLFFLVIRLIISSGWLKLGSKTVKLVLRSIRLNIGPNLDLAGAKEILLLYSVENDEVPVGWYREGAVSAVH